MNVNEVLQFVDRLVVEKKGRHLDDLQKAVVEGTWQRQSYNDIAEKYHVTEGHAGDVASELWQLLSKALGEDIKKSNFRSTIETIYIKSSQNPNICGNNKFVLQTINQPSQQDEQSNINTRTKLSYQDLNLAPKILRFYNRKTSLKTLYNWILNQNISLISVLGLSGIGKSYLVRKFIDLNLDQFEVIIWRSLKYPESLDLLIDDFLNICEKEIKTNAHNQLKQLFDIFREKRCLIILDDLQNIFISGELAGQYQPKYKDYQNFFKMIAEVEHQSNIILISQEKCPEMHFLDDDDELYRIKSLELSGLDNIDILKNTGLKDKDSWVNLINLYQGNPMYLQDVALLIKDVFDGNVADFLAENSSESILTVVTNKIRSHFNQLFNRLSPIEQQLILALSKIDQPVSREDLRQDLDLSSIDLINGLQSLKNRYLVTKIKADKILFKLSPIFREYVKNKLTG